MRTAKGHVCLRRAKLQRVPHQGTERGWLCLLGPLVSVGKQAKFAFVWSLHAAYMFTRRSPVMPVNRDMGLCILHDPSSKYRIANTLGLINPILTISGYTVLARDCLFEINQ